jgi:hypothetical protein
MVPTAMSRLDHRQPAGRHHCVVGAAQQHAVTGHQAKVLDQHVGDLVDPGLQLRVGGEHRLAVHRHPDYRAVAVTLRNSAVEQFGGGVQARRILQLGQVEAQFGPEFGRRQAVAGEGVDVGGGHDVLVLLELAQCFIVSRAMISFCTSVAPS